MVAHFIHDFPGMYLNTAWPTDDKFIPYKLFYVMCGALPYVWAMKRMIATGAATHAKAITSAKSKFKGKQIMDSMDRAALPTRKR